MSPLRMGATRVAPVSVEDVRGRGAALAEALDAGSRELDPALCARARQVVARVGERTSIAGGHTVVALAGATGSGKSSLFNDLVGADVAAVGARRPTTSTPTAAVWGAEPASELLDWLAVGARHHLGAREEPEGLSLDGLVLLDLPDFDSRLLEHRVEADRVLGLVDVFVWVTDPQKYADARLHHDYLAALTGHDVVTVVVLNQADRLTPDGAGGLPRGPPAAPAGRRSGRRGGAGHLRPGRQRGGGPAAPDQRRGGRTRRRRAPARGRPALGRRAAAGRGGRHRAAAGRAGRRRPGRRAVPGGGAAGGPGRRRA